MSTEESPLLSERILNDSDAESAIWNRFTERQKQVYVNIIGWTGLLPLFVSGSFVPSIPQIAKDLDSTGSVISLAVSLSIFATAIGSLTCAAYSTYYGRRPVYLCTLPFLCIGSLGVALSRSIPQLMIFRFIQAFGSSAGFSVGSAVIGDLYRLEERGAPMGVFYAYAMLGPSFAPVCGGLAAHYSSWRHMQFAISASGALAFIAIFFLLPETCHPHSRGIDKYLESEASYEGSKRSRFVWINSAKCLMLLRYPNLLAVGLTGTFALLTDFVLLIPLAYTIGKTYNITNEALIGACFLPSGLGNMLGGVIAGPLSDRTVIKWKKIRTQAGGEIVVEDRLRAAYIGAAVFVPASIFASGIVTRFVDGWTGLGLNLVCLFFNGIGLTWLLSTSTSYAVDAFYSRSAEAVAATNGCRALVLAVGSTAILPLIENLGVLGTNAISAALAWIGFGLLCLTIHYGPRMRAWVDDSQVIKLDDESLTN